MPSLLKAQLSQGAFLHFALYNTGAVAAQGGVGKPQSLDPAKC